MTLRERADWSPFFSSMAPEKKKTSQRLTFAWFLVCALEGCLNAYPVGAPSSSCATMLPEHGVGPQNTDSPYTVVVNSSTYRYGERVKGNYVRVLYVSVFAEH